MNNMEWIIYAGVFLFGWVAGMFFMFLFVFEEDSYFEDDGIQAWVDGNRESELPTKGEE